MSEKSFVNTLIEGLLESATREGNKMFNPNAPRKTEGFDSVVTDKEYEAVQHLIHAFDNYVKVHNECASKVKFGETTPYQRIQYAVFSDCGHDLIQTLDFLQDIYTLDKEVIDKWCEEDNVSVEEYEKVLEKKLFAKRMSAMFG